MKSFNIPLIATLFLFGFSIVLPACAYSDSSPLKQFKEGTSATDVKCNKGMVLVIKAEDGSPACVNPNSANILIERGWAEKIMSTTSSSELSSPTSCDNNLQPPIDFTKVSGYLLLYMPRNSIGQICADFSSDHPLEDLLANNTLVRINTQPVNLSIVNQTSIYQYSAHGIAITASRNNITAGSNTPIVYTIKTGNYSGLYYGYFSHFQQFAFAVGYDNTSKITIGNLTWSTGGVYFGPEKDYDVNITGLTNIGFKYIH